MKQKSQWFRSLPSRFGGQVGIVLGLLLSGGLMHGAGLPFVIEAEDFNYGGGQTLPVASAMPYYGGAYEGRTATIDIDFNRALDSSSPVYRNDNRIPMTPDMNSPDRGGWTVTSNYRMGWTGENHWYNYTRTFPTNFYKVYASLSYGDSSPNGMRGTLSKVVSGATTTSQVLQTLGSFNAQGSGGWGQNVLVPMMGTNGSTAILELGGPLTLRYTAGSGDIDYYKFVLAGPPTVSTNPASVTVMENRLASFRVDVANEDPVSYQWQSNRVNISGATSASYSFYPKLPASGSLYRCVLTNVMGSTTSAEAMLTVTKDDVRPRVLQAVNVGATGIRLTFDEPVAVPGGAASASFGLNNGATVSAASAGASNLEIFLAVSPLTFGLSYTVTINNVTDLAATPNTILPNAQIAFLASEYSPGDIGSPGIPGGVVRLPDNSFDVSGSGAGIGGTSDQFQFAWEQRTNDFDLQVRLAGVTITDPYLQAGLMVRDSLASNARFAGVFGSSAQLGNFFEYRTSAGGASTTTTLNTRHPANYPYNWLRLRRVGTVLYGFASLDAVTWTQLGSVNMGSLPSVVYFGLAVTSGNASKLATAGFRGVGTTASTATAAYVADREWPGPSNRRTGLVFSEIMYHPPVRADLKELEFVELYNARGTPENLSGWRISGEVEFEFPAGFTLQAGEFVVVAKSPADVQSVYGLTNVLGPFANTNSLANDGGVLRLRNAADAIRLEVNYRDVPPWPVAADGAGHSLVLASPSYGEDDARAWAASQRVGGSPGQVDAIYAAADRTVVINEFLTHTDLPLVDSVELYNRSTVAVDLGGCVLTDDIRTNLYRFPSPTMLAAGGFLALDANQLGFNLDAAGERLFLVNSNATRVVDAVEFGPQENGVSSGRCPDGSSTIRRLAQPTFGGANGAWRLEPVVINEIMYNPISGDADDEYVELHNRSAAAVDVSGWTLDDAVEFKFPAGTTLPAGGYLVVGRNQQRLLANYPGVLSTNNALGDYSGSLGNGGERLALRMPDDLVSTNVPPTTNRVQIVVSEVTYGTGGRWGQYADAGGSSMELVDPTADLLRAGSWRDSDETAKGQWTQVALSTRLDNGNGAYAIDRLFIGMLGAGEALVDDVSLTGTGANLVSNGTFESGTSGWSFFGNHLPSTVDAGAGYLGGRCLHLRSSGDTDTGPNTVRTVVAAGLSDGGTASLSARVRWVAGWPEVLFRLHGNYGEFPVRLTVPKNLGTPGQANSRRVANAGPAIYDVTHYPPAPQGGEAVVVSGRASDSQPIGVVRLRYRVDPASTVTDLAMRDDGLGGDRVAGDGLYSATIPAQGGGTTVAFRVEARDDTGVSTTVFPADAPARECLVRWGDPLPFGNFWHYHLWLTQASQSAWNGANGLDNTWRDTTLVYGNHRVIYNVGCRDKGSPWHGGRGDIACTVPADDRLLGATDRVFGSIGNGGNDDPSSIRSQFAAWMAQQMGIPYLNSQYIFVYRNGAAFRTVMEDLEQPYHGYAESWFPNPGSGDLYKIAMWFEFGDDNSGFSATSSTIDNFTTTGGAKKLARYRWTWQRRSNDGMASNFTNLFDLVTVINASDAQFVPRLNGLADMEQWLRCTIFSFAMGNWDAWTYNVGQNMYIYKPDGERWSLMPWDIDFTLGLGDGPSGTLWGGQDGVMNRVYDTPAFQRMVWRAYQDVVAGPYVQANYGPQIDMRRQLLIRNGVTGLESGSSITNYVEARRGFIQGRINSSDAASFAITSNGGSDFTSSTAVVTLTGTAPFAAAVIEVNGIPYPASWTDIRTFSLSIPLTQVTNVLVLTARDRLGNVIPGYADSITVRYTGAIQRVQDYVSINEIQYNGLGSGTSFIEIYNRSTSTPFDLSGFRLDGVGYVFPEGAILQPGAYLVLAEDRAAFAAAYGGAVVPFDQFPGNLDNGGEYLALVKPGATADQDLVISDVRYNDKLPWPLMADGQGPSLQLIDAAQDEYRVGNWGTSITTNHIFRATPGVANVGARSLSAFPLLWINEVLPDNTVGQVDRAGDHEPWIELYNSGTTVLDLSAYYLTDSYTNLTKWQFPAGTTVGPTNFLVIWADGQTNAVDPGQLHAGFRLNPTNGSVALVRMQGNPAVPAVMDFLNYTILTPDRAFGSYPDGEPRNRRLLYYPTQGRTNDPATPVLSVTVNEWMARNTSTKADPADGDFDDWFELHNAGTNLVDLASYSLTDNPTNTSRFRVPPGYMIPAGGFLLVWADNETKQNVATNEGLHVDFQLSVDGDQIALFDPNGVLLDSISFSTQTVDVAEGRFPDGGPLPAAEMTLATPGEANIVAGANLPPIVTVPGVTNVVETLALTFKATATGPEAGQTLLFSLAPGAPAGAGIDGQSGQFAWTPTESQGPGVYTITVRATDNGVPPRIGTAKVTVTVTESNRPPVLAAVPNKSADEGTLLSFALSGSDPDLPANGLTYSLEPGAPDGLTVDPVTGVVSWTPAESQGPGQYPVTVRLSDNGAPPLSVTQSFVIAVAEVNNPPDMPQINPQTVEELQTFSYQVQAVDPDSPPVPLVFSLEQAPLGVRIDSTTGMITWVTTEADGPGNVTIVVRVTENTPGGLSSSRTFGVTVTERNVAPTLEPLARVTIKAGETAAVQLVGKDSDLPAQKLTYSLDNGAPPGATVDAASGLFVWATSADAPGSTNTIWARVTDSGALSTSTRLVVVVVPAFRVVIHEIMHHPAAVNAAYVEFHNVSTNTTYDLSGLKLAGHSLGYTFPAGTTLGPGTFLCVAGNPAAFASAYGAGIRVVGPWTGGFVYPETLQLQQGTNVLDSVSFDLEAPWPAAAAGAGGSLQLLDANQDNDRAGNWVAISTNGASSTPQWQYVTATGVQATTLMYVYLAAAGEVHLDDMKLVQGSTPEAGANLLVNGDFETGLATGWNTTANTAGSTLSTAVRHSGNSSLKLVCGIGGSTQTDSLWQNVAGLTAGAEYTLSFWYLPNTNNTTLTVRFSGGWIRVDPSILWQPGITGSVYTPGAPNDVARPLDPFPTLRLNEVQLRNVGGLADRVGDRDPWAELLNTGTAPVSLDGLHLSDDPAELAKWTFPPGVVLQGGEYLVLFADGEPAEGTVAEPHTSFRLPTTTGVAWWLALSRDQGGSPAAVDAVGGTVPGDNQSMGRVPDGASEPMVLLGLPSPGSSNTAVVTPPEFDTVSVAESGAVTLTWFAVSGRTYRAEYRSALVAGQAWVPLQTVVATGAQASVVDATAAGHRERYYQVVLLP